jgi:pre-rRNA-processing protein TSR3
MKGYRRRLPLLLAANPINYGQIGKLSSLEALSAALYINSHIGQAERLLSLFKWGETFLTLNHEPLDRYKTCKDVSDLERAEKEFFNLNAVSPQ